MPRSRIKRLAAPEVVRALGRAPLGTNAAGFDLGFRAGREFQFEQIKRVLCNRCASESPIFLINGTAVHMVPDQINEERYWRVACDANGIMPFKP